MRELDRDLHDAIRFGSGDLISLRTQLNAARDELHTWQNTITQVFAAPVGMVAVFERRDTFEEYIPVAFLALHRSGRVLPYILVGNCESKVPSDYPNYLRIDFAQLMGAEVPLEAAATEVFELAPAPKEAAWPAA